MLTLLLWVALLPVYLPLALLDALTSALLGVPSVIVPGGVA